MFQSAMQSLVGGLVAWFLTCALAGAAVTAATESSFEDVDWLWGLAWVWHLAVAGAGIWGLLVICIHVGCASALIQGTDHALRVLTIAFVTQLTCSAIVVVCVDSYLWQRVVLVWLTLGGVGIAYICGSYLSERRLRLARQAEESSTAPTASPRHWPPPSEQWGANSGWRTRPTGRGSSGSKRGVNEWKGTTYRSSRPRHFQ